MSATTLKTAIDGAPEVEPEPPRPLQRPLEPADPFPMEALGGVLEDAARAIVDQVQCPHAIAGQAVLAAANLTVQGHADIELPHGKAVPTSSFFVTVALSGERKSSADHMALAPVGQREEALRRQHGAESAGYTIRQSCWEAARKKILGDKKATYEAMQADLESLGAAPAPPLTPLLVCPEPTFEGLCWLLQDGQPSVGLFSSEGGQFIGGYAMSDDHWLKTAAALSALWDGEPIKRVRRGDGVIIMPGRRVAMHLLVQPGVADRLLGNRNLADQGLLSRILASAPPSAAGGRFWREPKPESRRAIRQYSAHLYSKAQYDAEGLDGYVRRPAGFERYQIVERRPGDRLIFERVENHWSGRDAPFAEMEFRWAPEPATKLALLLSGEAHIANLTRELQPDALARGMKIVSSRNPSAQVVVIFNGLYMRSGDPAFKPDLPWVDIRVREAMNRAINRPELLEVLYDGRAERLVRYGMHPTHEGYVPELEERFEADYGYDPERARQLLAEAGYPDAFPDPTVPIILSALAGNPEIGTLAELIQVYFEEVGLQTEMREIDWASMNELGRGRRAYVINPTRNAPIRPTELHLFNSYTPGGSPNHGYEDDRIQALYDALRQSLDSDERNKIAREAFTHLYEQYSDMPIAGLNADVVINPEYVANWSFPGVTTAGVSHWDLIEPATTD